ncbi:mechanosensitive ion channel family protein [Halobacillus amylolyticus]|uniref:Mechanosensitive ion channel n=1 Tax=Halobacillus amylolyticus TaxID=2932259 RepID=A0ABY4H948_9BACI|nr:mechanosensitive ion channel domain-containing protein [Halobacillus amylolyticus]UOR11207.1 mechanosensitive ion channel [Halobacillus amylolyticus]
MSNNWEYIITWYFWQDALLVCFALLGIFALKWILHFVIVRTIKHNNRIQHALNSFINWAAYNGAFLFLLIYFSKTKWLFQAIFTVGEVRISVFLIVIAILIISLANRLSKILNHLLLPAVYERYRLDRGIRFTLERVFHYVIMVIAVIVSLTTVGIDLSALTVFAGVVGVGIGFGMQNIASNFISGLIILFERPIKVGDRIIVNDVIGDVEKINMRATVIRTIENEHIIMPNSYFLEEQVVNRSYSDPRIRLAIPVGVAYGTDVHLVKKLLEELAEEAEQASEVVLAEPAAFVNFVGFGESSIDFELFVWLSNPEEVIRTKSDLNFRVHDKLLEHDIEIPFPQRDLHVRSIDEEVLRQTRK